MENAGIQIFGLLRQVFQDLALRRPILLCGKGNNGGDTFVLARHLRNRGIPFHIVLFGRRSEVRGSAGANLEALHRLGVRPIEALSSASWSRVLPLLAKSDLIIDGIFGTGLSRPISRFLSGVFRDVNDAKSDVVAIDIPSGLSGDSADVPGPCIVADHTVTFARPKVPHLFPPAETFCGRLHVVDISIPPEAVDAEGIDLHLMHEASLMPLLPTRHSDSHKGTYGHALIIAGSRGKGGAARMVAMGALRAGCGLVTAAVPEGIQGPFLTRAMEVMTEGLPETDTGSIDRRSLVRILRLIKGKKVVAIGPGLTTHPETEKLLRNLVPRIGVPVVLDADGLNAFSGSTGLLTGRRRPLVLTPHPGELARLLGISTRKVQSRRVEVAREFARRCHCHLVLKGHRTLVATPSGTVYVNTSGNPGMATGGSGDVLSGVLAGLIAQGIEVGAAVRLGVYLHGVAGDLAAARVGQMPLLARDILARLPSAMARFRRPPESGHSTRRSA